MVGIMVRVLVLLVCIKMVDFCTFRKEGNITKASNFYGNHIEKEYGSVKNRLNNSILNSIDDRRCGRLGMKRLKATIPR
jgi:hypothetical protein